MKHSDDEKMKNILERIDRVFDPKKQLDLVLDKAKPRLALEMTPTKRHNPSQDLFRIYTYNLLKELSKKFEIILIYRDVQATVDLSLEESKRSIQESTSMLHNSKVPFKMYYESEILQKHLIDMPESFFRHLYSNILHREHNHFSKELMASSASLAVMVPLLELLNIDVLLCMSEEDENVNLIRKIQKDSDYFPIIFYRSLKDIKNKEHSFEDAKRDFPRIGWKEKELYSTLKKNNTTFDTFSDWYKKLGITEAKEFNHQNKAISFSDLQTLVKNKEISYEEGLKKVAKNMADFLEKEGVFLELASKEMKLNLEDKNSNKILNCLNTPSRINILKLLDKSNLSAYEISKQINVSLPTTLFHLTKMQEAGIIERDKNKSYSLKTNRFILYI